MMKVFKHLYIIFFRRKALMRFYRIKGWKRGRSATRWGTAFMVSMLLPLVTIPLTALFEMPMSVNRFGPFLNALLNPWDGLMDAMFFVYCGTPFVIWGLMSLVFILMGIDINDRK